MDLAEALDDVRPQLLPGFVRVDRLVLRGVVLEDTPQIREERDQKEVEDEDRHPDQSLDDYELAGALDSDPVGQESRRNLEQHDRESDRDGEREDQLRARQLGVDRLLLAFGLYSRGLVVRGNGKRAKADREGLAERNDPADHRQTEDHMSRHRRLDRLMNLCDVAVGLAHGDGPVRWAAHHHALEDGLSPNVRHVAVLAAACAAGLLEPALEALDASARVDQLLLARVERMAVRADLDVELGLRGPRLERVPAGARHGRKDIVGVNLRLHRRSG